MLALKIPKNKADFIRRILLKHSLIDLDFKIKRSDEYVYIPILKKPDNEVLREYDKDFEVVYQSFDAYRKRPTSLKGYLKDVVEQDVILEIKKSFDIIGDVVILEIPEDLESLKYKIADAALKFTKRKSVYRKTSEIKGVTRTRTLEHLAGEDQSETLHTEYGSRLLLDVRKVYFSPRLATERERIVEQVSDGEVIVDLFAGVGPFSVNIARQKTVEIYAVDINPHAIYYLKRNMKLNKMKGRIIPVLGDAYQFLSEKDVNADRIIMNLPGTACKYLEEAINSLKVGGTLHYYEFSSDYQNPIKRIKEASRKRDVTILNKRKVKSSSPGTWHIGIDACIN
jgi:tRNA (guanine37-N1)-methyltransferase